MSIIYRRNLGAVFMLLPQEWLEVLGKTIFCCHGCGAVYELPETHRVQDGLVVPALSCPTETCSALEYVKLDGWREEVLR